MLLEHPKVYQENPFSYIKLVIVSLAHVFFIPHIFYVFALEITINMFRFTN